LPVWPADVLVLAAFEPELSPLWKALGQHGDGRVGRLAVSGRVCGVGLATATAGAAAHIAAAGARVAVAVGTCGAYAGSGIPVGAVVVARRVVLADWGGMLGAAQSPDAVHPPWVTHAAVSRGLVSGGARPVDVATTLGVTVDDAAAARIERATGAHAEHMEAYGFAAACGGAGVAFTAVLGVANVVGSEGRAQWRSNHEATSAAAIAHIVRWLEAGAPGIPPR